jgi:hypothetical protein
MDGSPQEPEAVQLREADFFEPRFNQPADRPLGPREAAMAVFAKSWRRSDR